jgi:hypothetical protein
MTSSHPGGNMQPGNDAIQLLAAFTASATLCAYARQHGQVV